MLRHTLATMALLHFDPPWEISFLAKWLGHTEIAITYKIYGHFIAKAPPSSYTLDASATKPLQSAQTAEIINIHGG